ncbi:MAG TPA: SRPBCC domain-containing protein [Nitrososphaerales archaeon]|nr:SRPBCC domain-containing protein [Nitrososphaerales archaeon]HUK75595.1 SRPBCC domain-containing protein [Nitrososphaerales archaeon]
MSSEITKSVLIDAPASVIFRALTDEKELVQWMPRTARMDPRVGGEYEFVFYKAANKSETAARGRIVEIVPDRKLVYTFAWTREGPAAPSTLLTWTLEEGSDGKTRVTLVHSGVGKDAFAVNLGWGYYLGNLSAHCAGKGGLALERDLQQDR